MKDVLKKLIGEETQQSCAPNMSVAHHTMGLAESQWHLKSEQQSDGEFVMAAANKAYFSLHSVGK